MMCFSTEQHTLVSKYLLLKLLTSPHLLVSLLQARTSLSLGTGVFSTGKRNFAWDQFWQSCMALQGS